MKYFPSTPLCFLTPTSIAPSQRPVENTWTVAKRRGEKQTVNGKLLMIMHELVDRRVIKFVTFFADETFAGKTTGPNPSINRNHDGKF